MNDPEVLKLYTQLVIFQQDTTKSSMIFDNPDITKQDLLYSLARQIGLEFTHTLRPPHVTLFNQMSLFSLNLHQDVHLPSYGMNDYSSPETFMELSQFSPFNPTLPATPPDEGTMTPDEIAQINANDNNLLEMSDGDPSQKYSWMDLFPEFTESPEACQPNDGKGGTHYTTLRHPAPRQRTTIACKYCRRHKVSVILYSVTQDNFPSEFFIKQN